jgi:hypothetical protein
MSVHHYHTDDCTIPVPAGFVDRTTNVLEWKIEENESLVLVIHRELLPPSDPPDASPAVTLERFVARETKDYASKFAGLRFERDEAMGDDSGFPMTRKVFRWKKGADVLYHHQVFVLAGARVVVFTGAAKARHRESVDFMMDNALTNFRVRGD